MYFAELKGLSRSVADESIHKWAKRFTRRRVSRNYRRKTFQRESTKIQFMTAIIHNPDLVVLDEPFSGLDPVNTDILKSIIIDLVKQGKYVIMSAHQMATIEEFCSNILIMNKGKTVLQGNLNEIKATYPVRRAIISTNQDISKYLKDFQVEHEKDFTYTIKISDEKSAQKLLAKLIENHILIEKFEVEKPTLNDIFIEKSWC